MSAVCLFLAVTLLLYCWLPLLVENFLLPRVLPAKIASDYQLSVYRLGLRGCSLKISGRPDANPPIIAGNVQAHWSLSGLMDGRVNLLVIEGLQLKVPGQATGTKPPADSEKAGGAGLPLLVDTILIKNSVLTLAQKGYEHTIGFSMRGQRVGMESLQEQEGTVQYSFQVTVATQEIAAEFTFAPQKQLLSGSIKTNIDLPRLHRELGTLLSPSLDIRGNAETSLSFATRLAPFSLNQLQADVNFEDFQVRSKGITIRSNDGKPALLSLSGSQESLKLEASGLTIKHPLLAAVDFDAVVSFPQNGFQWQGRMHVEPAADQKIAQDSILSQAPPVVLQHQGMYLDDELELNISSLHQDGEAKPFLVETGKVQVKADRFALASKLFYRPQDKENKLNISGALQGDDIIITSPEIFLQLPLIRFDGTGDYRALNGRNDVKFSGGLTVADGSFVQERQELSLQQVQLHLPLLWPVEQNRKQGKLSIDNITLRTVELGKLHATLEQDNDALSIDGALDSPFIPDSSVGFRGVFQVPDAAGSLGMLSFSALDVPVSLDNFSPFFPALDSVAGSGLVNLEGEVELYRKGIAGFLSLGLLDGSFEIPGMETKAEGIQLQLVFPGLPTLHTSPEQKLAIDRLTSKKIVVTDIKSSFQLESPESLFIEKLSADWAGGRVFTSSLRLQKGKTGFAAALLCDRLELAAVLTQLGLAQAEGTGRVSGRVPALYEEGNLYVDNGFLFSTPGETGTLKIIRSEHLTAAIPQDIPHFSPIHFAGAALQDFQYNWAKLLISSEEENLLLQLQIDGKPANKLPYRFDTKQNVFVRLDEGETGGIEQPIKLDVNFNVPLNELLRYHKQIQPFLRNIR